MSEQPHKPLLGVPHISDLLLYQLECNAALVRDFRNEVKKLKKRVAELERSKSRKIEYELTVNTDKLEASIAESLRNNPELVKNMLSGQPIGV